MLERTFVHLPGVGPKKERQLWECGIDSWEAAIGCCERVPGFSGARWNEVRQRLEASRRSLAVRDHSFFSESLPGAEHWRAYPAFKRHVAFLDIETTGLGHWADVTVIGIYDGIRTTTYVAGDNMDDFAENIADFGMLVTFNGRTFDVPFLQRRFPSVTWDHLHVDLRFDLGKLGLKGGLKSIERQLGIAREDGISEMSGDDAVRLWYEYLRGDEEALAQLIAYNAADVENLQVLMEFAYERLAARLMENCAG